MKCSISLESDHNRGKIKMKTINAFKNSYKDQNLGNIVDQLCTRLQDIQDQESVSQVGMPMCSIEQTEAVRRYYAAFPALQKGQESPLQYYLPAPAWCRKPATDNQVKMQCELTQTKDWNSRNKKHFSGKERRNSYNGQKRNKKRWNTYSKSFDSKDSLPEWVTYEGVWDMETQDPVKEFIRAIALDEGYGTCENTVTDDIRDATVKIVAKETVVPDLDDGLDLDADWIIPLEYEPRPLSPTEEQLYAKFEAKFDSSIEALWSRDQNTPDDDYQDLPIDFHELLASPSDYMLANPNDEKSAPISFESFGIDEGPLPCERGVSVLPEQLQPLNLTDVEPVLLAPEPGPLELHSFAFYEGVELYEVLAAVAVTMRSFIALNHSRDTSGFVEVMPRRARPLPLLELSPAASRPASPPASPPDREDLLTSARTHFRPIRREADAARPRYADGDTFDIRGDLDPVEERRSDSGGVYIGAVAERYLEYRAARTINYSRLNLTAEQRCPDLEESGLRLRFPMRQQDAAVQTEPIAAADAWSCEECGHAAKKMRAGTDPVWAVWGEAIACSVCAAPPATVPAAGADDLSREWEELLSDISAAHARYASGGEAGDEGAECTRADRKRRHSAALRCAPACTHPHARFLPCCTLAVDRPLTR